MGRTAGSELRLGAAFMQDSHVVEVLVLIGKPVKSGLDLGIAVRGVSDELVGDGESQVAQGDLIFRIGGQHVETDRLGLFRLIEQTIVLGLGVGLRHSGHGDGF